MKPIFELNQKVRGLLEFTPLQYMLDAISENVDLAKIFVDDEVTTNTCIVLLKHIIFVGGEFSQVCFEYLCKEILKQEIRSGQDIFYVYSDTEGWEVAFENQFPGMYEKYKRSLLKNKPINIVSSPPIEIVEISEALLNTAENSNMVIDEIVSTGTYKDMKDFFSRGIGFAPVIGNRICGFCTSEYPSQNSVAIGIEVLNEHQKQGLAKALTKAFLHKAEHNNYCVYWECWKNNMASVNTALSCGFEKVADYPLVFLDLRSQHNFN